MAKLVDKHGVHLYGCGCRECSKINRTCPECLTKYYTDPSRPELEECHHCMWTPFKVSDKSNTSIELAPEV